MKKNPISLTLALILASSVAATAEDLTVFDIGSLDGDPSGSLSPSTTAANVTGGDLVRGGVSHDPAFNGSNLTHSDGLYGAGQWPDTDVADPNSYLEFTVTPDANFSLNVESLSFTLFTEHVVDGSNFWIGPETWDFAYSLDGFSTSFAIDSGVATPAVADLAGADARYAQHSFDYTGLDIDVPDGQTLSFRFFGYDRPEGAQPESYGGFSNNADGDPAPGDGVVNGDNFDSQWVNNGSNVIVTGAVIPEPSHVAAGIAGFALFVTLIIRRRRKQ